MKTERVYCLLNQLNHSIRDDFAFYLKIYSVEIDNKKYNFYLVTMFLSFIYAVFNNWNTDSFSFVALGLRP